MTAEPRQPTTLVPLNAAGIPQALRQHPRWAPWRAVWNAKRQKYDKVPCTAAGHGLSTARPERWLSFDAAVRAAQARPDQFAGVGYLMTQPHGIVGVDLDRCLSGADLVPWAGEVLGALGDPDALADLGVYAEVSPSGRGVRLFVSGESATDWTNHEVGVEVYSGHEPRFLTVTGQRLPFSADDVCTAPAQALPELAQRYARERSSAQVISLELPDLLGPDELPDLAGLDLPWQARDFLADGTTGADRSRTLFTTAVALYRAGLDAAQVLSALAGNPHAWALALDHRRQDPDRALLYLWVEHTQKARGRAQASMIGDDDFEALPAAVGEAPKGADAVKAPMFDIVPAAEFMVSKPVRWLLKGLLPHAEVGAVFGASGAGKSFLVLDLALAVARGQEWRGHRCTQGSVLYVAAEGAGGVMQRLKAHAQFHGYDMRDVPMHVLGAAPNLLERAHVEGLEASIAARCLEGVQLIVLDTLAQVTPGGNENSAEDMGRALAHCRRLAQRTGAMVLLVAHAGKDGERGLRGWSGIKAALDVEILVERDGVYREATVTKVKDGTNEGARYPFGLQTVVLGQDEDGDDIVSAVPQFAAEARGLPPPKGANQRLVLEVLASVTDLDGAPTEAELVEQVAAQMPAEKGVRRNRERAKEAVSALLTSGRISVEGGKVRESV